MEEEEMEIDEDLKGLEFGALAGIPALALIRISGCMSWTSAGELSDARH